MIGRWLAFLLLCAGLLAAVPAVAQPGTDEQLAAQYFQNGDYERAALYYEKLYKRQPTPYYYDQYFKTLSALGEFERAEKLVKDQMKRTDDPKYLVDLGGLYREQGERDKAEQQFQKALKELRPDQNQVRLLANAFTKVNEFDLALETYQRGQRLLKNDQLFTYEMANLYAAKGDVPLMISSYMDLLEVNEAYVQSVQNSLGRYIDFTVRDDRTEALRTELLRRIQRQPDRTIYSDMLIWMYVQQKDLTAAYIQSKAMDKRFSGDGERLMELGDIAMNNRDLSTAVKCYEYVVGLGSERPNYLTARMNLVSAMHEKVLEKPEPTQEELQALLGQYEVALSELGRTNTTVRLLRDQAYLKAYYLNDPEGAVALLDEAIRTPGLDPRQEAELKLALGDVHVLRGEIWDASLLYSQVDLDFKYDMLGHEARFRNARVSFYAGDFLWCQAQLDILKASTSKLIANDAMELSLLITDNLGLDSNSIPLGFYARAELLTFQHRYDDALGTLDSLDQEFPMHSLGDEVLFSRYRIAYARHRYAEAATYLVKVTELYPLDILMDNALFELGLLYEEKLNDPDKAQEYYQKLLFEHTGSIFVPEARQHFRALRGDLPEKEPVPEPILEQP